MPVEAPVMRMDLAGIVFIAKFNIRWLEVVQLDRPAA
jgi:hypothetical protein